MTNKLDKFSNILEAKKCLLPDVLDFLRSNTEWEELEKARYESYQELNGKLDKSKQEELSKLSDLETNLSAIELEVMYYRGIEDAVEILKTLKVI